MKGRFDGLDVQAMVAYLQRTILGRRIVNIYDGDTSDTYIFKLEGMHYNTTTTTSTSTTTTTSTDSAVIHNTTPTDASPAAHTTTTTSSSSSSSKEFLLIESGVRFHLTQHYPSSNSNNNGSNSKHMMPSPFVAKLRKHVRQLRLEKIIQLGTDRVVLLQLGVGQYKHSIILELYAKGNIILVDQHYIILSLLRSHIYQKQQEQLQEPQQTQTLSVMEQQKPQSDNNEHGTGSEKKTTTTTTVAMVKVGQVYPVTYATSIGTNKDDKDNNDTNENNDEKDNENDDTENDDTENEKKEQRCHEEKNNLKKSSIVTMTHSKQFIDWLRIQAETILSSSSVTGEIGATTTTTTKKTKKQIQQLFGLKNILLKPESGISHYGPGLIEHCILIAIANATVTTETGSTTETGGTNQNNNEKLFVLTPNTSIVDLLSLVDNKNDNDNNDKIDQNNNENNIFQALLKALQEEGKHVIDSLQEASKKETTGYVLYRLQNQQQQQLKGIDTATTTKEDETISLDVPNNTTNQSIKIYEEFVPHLLKQHEKRLYMEYTNFSEAVDDFYSILAQQKAVVRAQVAEVSAITKLEKIKVDQLDRIRSLEVEQEQMYDQARLVQYHADSVNKALLVINSGLDSGMDWDQLETIVSIEKKQNQNPIALLIHQLDLENDCMILRLPTIKDHDHDEDMDNDTGGDNDLKSKPEPIQATLDVKISLTESAHANASRLFAKYRSSKEKSQKTIVASTKALKAAEEHAKRQLLEAQKRKHNHHHLLLSSTSGVKRSVQWYEKFHWFITSDNYLVVGGKDSQQNELLVKRYLRPGDAYLHADVFGAASCILRAKRRRIVGGQEKKKMGSTSTTGGGNKTAIVPLSEIALREAGNFTICHSSAWKTKTITSAYWVESYQVSKTAPTGEYLTPGAFMIRGKKNYLPPTSPLEMGIGILFRMSDDDIDSMNRHKNERRDFALLELENVVNDDMTLLGKEEDDDNDNEDGELNTNEFINTTTMEDGKENKDTTLEVNIVDVQHIVPTKAVNEETLEPITDDDNDDDEDENTDVVGSAKEEELDNNTTNDDEVESKPVTDDIEKDQQQQKRGLSVRDRKLIKKYGSLEAANRILETLDKPKSNENDSVSKSSNVSVASTTITKNMEKPKRGKKTKEKLVQKKYADQDEEDRMYALLALHGGEKKSRTKKGSSSNKKGKGLTSEFVKQQEIVAAETVSLLVKDSSLIATKLPEQVRNILAECVTVRDNNNETDHETNEKESSTPDGGIIRWEKLDADTLEQLITLDPIEAQLAAANRFLKLTQSNTIDNFSSSLGGIIRTIRRYGYETIGKEEKKDKGGKRVPEVEQETKTDEDDGDLAVDDTLEISKLTGKPHPEDLLLYGVPVCGPYLALQQYTYRLKLTPGTMKRGKAAKQCMEMFLKTEKNKLSTLTNSGSLDNNNNNNKQLDLIKRITDNEWVQVICADTKISAPGTSKVVKGENKSKKSKK